MVTKLYNKFWKKHDPSFSEQSMNGKTVVITGGNSGIGYETAKQLLRLERLDVLICNAGIGWAAEPLTEDGFNTVIQANYLGHFLLAQLFLPKLKQCRPSRIVSVSSDLHKSVKYIDWSDAFTQNQCSDWGGAYPTSNVFKILMALKLKQDLLDGTVDGVNVFALTPGWVSTSIQDAKAESIGWLGSIFYTSAINFLKYFFAKTPEDGARVVVYCACESTLEKSKDLYFESFTVGKPSPIAIDQSSADKLYEASLKAVGLKHMDMLISLSTFIVFITVLIVSYMLWSTNKNASSIPFVKHKHFPMIGHTISFLRDRRKFLAECRQRYGACFTIQLVNQSITFVLSPSDWPTIIRHPSLTFQPHKFGMMVFDAGSNALGFNETELEIHRYYIKYLKNNDGLQPMTAMFVRRLYTLITHEKMLQKNGKGLSEWTSIGLLEFSHRMLFEPSALTLFGEIDPLSIERDYRFFDNNIHYFTALLPSWIYRIFFRHELQARYRLNNSWLKKQHAQHESDFIKDRTDAILKHPEWFSQQEYGGKQTFILWASLANSIPALFWCLFYILNDADAMESIQQEIDKYLPISSVDEWTLDRLSSCVNLNSVINEVLRLVSAPMIMRRSMDDTNIILKDGRIMKLKVNDAVALFPAVAHRDPDLFSNPNDFIFNRFTQTNPDSTFGFMPFGMGANMCPGRFFIRNEIKICIAMFLQSIEFKLHDVNVHPKEDTNRIGVGVAPPDRDILMMYRYKL